MSRPRGSGSLSSRKKDLIKEIPDQIKGVGGSSAGTCALVSTSRSCRGYRDTPPGAYEVLVVHPEWTVREAASKLVVSVGTISNWRKRIKRGDPPKRPGRPRAPEDRVHAALERQMYLADHDPREGLVRIIRRLVRRPRRLSKEELLDLRIDLYQTRYTVYLDRHGKHVPVSTNGDAIVREALGPKRAKRFLKEFWKNFSRPQKAKAGHEEPFHIEDFRRELPAKATHCREWAK